MERKPSSISVSSSARSFHVKFTQVGNRADRMTRPSTGSSDVVPAIRNICCVGAGYVGGPTAAVIAYQNPYKRVTVVDHDERRVRRWNSKHLPIYEPNLASIVRIARDGLQQCSINKSPEIPSTSDIATEGAMSSSGNDMNSNTFPPHTSIIQARKPNLIFSTDVAKCISEADIIIITVNTPTKSRGSGAGSATDMTAFEAVIGVIARHSRPGSIIVEKSTVPCRTAQSIQAMMAIHQPGSHFEILSNPEFLAAGTAIRDLMNPDRVLIGSSTTYSGCQAAEALASIYATWVPRSRIITTNIWSSELSKLVANSMLAQRISSINSVSAICEKIGANVDEVALSIGCDPRIGQRYLKAGIGFGGSCFKKDILSLVYLADSLKLEDVGEYWRQVLKINDYQRDRFSQHVIKCLNNTLKGKKIAVLGYAFKAYTSDTRESPALEIIKTLLEEEPLEIAIFDPCCNPVDIKTEVRMLLGAQTSFARDDGPISVYSNAYDACADSNAVLITTELDETSNVDQTLPHTPCENSFISRPVMHEPTAKTGIPWPFECSKATASEVSSFHNKTSLSLPSSEHRVCDPLQLCNAEPECAEDCPDCGLARVYDECSKSGSLDRYRSKQKLDWNKISDKMKQPKWVFDGRGILNGKELVKMGIKLESLGRPGNC